MFGDGALTFHEFATREPHPLAVIHDAVLEFLRGRTDAVLCGSQAVNAYVTESRMTQDVDVVSPRAAELAEEIRALLRGRFRIAARVRVAKRGVGHRVYQARKSGDRPLVDVWAVACLPPAKRVKKVLVVTPPELIARKVIRMAGRQRTPKSMTDKADLHRLLLAFPELKSNEGAVADRLRAAEAGEGVMAAWAELAAEVVEPEEPDAKFLWGRQPG
jgi:hypothetical protein